MAQRRMFSLKIIDTDLFLDMPQSARLLYYDLSMRADDDGFVASPKKIQRMIGCSDDDLKLLIAKQFIIPFESGICVIKHWRIHNYIRSDRYAETMYKDEKEQLTESNGTYELNGIRNVIPNGNQKSYQRDTQVRLGKDKLELGKDSINKPKKNNKKVYSENEELNKTILDFIDMRKTIKKPISEAGIKLMLSKLNTLSTDGNTQIEILNQSILNSWQGIFPLKANKEGDNFGSIKPKEIHQPGPSKETLRLEQIIKERGYKIEDIKCDF